MSPLILAIVASVVVDGGGTAIALDDGTVWIVYDREWEELGGCADGEVVTLDVEDGALAIACGDGSSWAWRDDLGWVPRAEAGLDLEPWTVPTQERSWWPTLELTLRAERTERVLYEGWIRLRWDL